MKAKKREHICFRAKDGIFVILTIPGNTVLMVGTVVDVSRGGLGFTHIGERKQVGTSVELQILEDKTESQFVRGIRVRGFSVRGIPCRIVSSELDPLMSRDSVGFCRTGVKFGKLSEHQRKQLQVFFQRASADSAPLQTQ